MGHVRMMNETVPVRFLVDSATNEVLLAPPKYFGNVVQSINESLCHL